MNFHKKKERENALSEIERKGKYTFRNRKKGKMYFQKQKERENALLEIDRKGKGTFRNRKKGEMHCQNGKKIAVVQLSKVSVVQCCGAAHS